MSSKKLLSGQGAALADSALRKYMNPVIREALAELTLVKSTLKYSQGPIERENISDIQSRLRMVTGSLVMLSLSRAASVLHTCHQYISDAGHGAGAGSLHRAGLQSLVEIIGAISDYLETFLGTAGNQEGLLSAVEDKALQLDKISAGDTVVDTQQSGHMSQSWQTDTGGFDPHSSMDGVLPAPLADRERLHVELKSAFLQRVEKNIRAGRMVLEMLGKTHESVVLANEFRKILGLLKTSALAAGISEVVELCHSMESLVGMLDLHNQPNADEIYELLIQSYEQLTEIVDQYNLHEAVTPVEDLVLRINKHLVKLSNSVKNGGRQSATVDRRQLETRRNLSGGGRKNHVVSGKRNYQQSPGNLRHGRPSRLDSKACGHVGVQVDLGQGYMSLKSRLDEMKKELDRLRAFLRPDETSSVFHKEGSHDYSDSAGSITLSEYLDESDRLYDMNMGLMNSLAQGMERQQQIIAALEAALYQARMGTVSSQIARLKQTVEKTGIDLSRKVRLDIVGESLRLEDMLLNKLIEPLQYLIIYSIEHSIEDPVLRVNSGKPEAGSITLEFARDNSDLVINIHDDGAGCDLDEVRRKAIDLGYISIGEKLADTGVAELLFDPGFNRESGLSGLKSRGIRLDEVADTIRSLGGSIVCKAVRGSGNTFTIRVPGRLNISQVLMVLAGKEIYAIPRDNIEDIVYIQAREIDALRLNNDYCYHHDGHDYQFRNLRVVLGQGPSANPEQDTAYPVVLISTGNKYFALQVDQLKGQREIIVNQTVPDLNQVKVISGATLLSDGRLVLALELGALLGEDIGDLKALERLSSV